MKKHTTKVYYGVCQHCGTITKSIREVKNICFSCDMKFHPENYSTIPDLKI